LSKADLDRSLEDYPETKEKFMLKADKILSEVNKKGLGQDVEEPLFANTGAVPKVQTVVAIPPDTTAKSRLALI
jgi:hypothetical protein